MWQKTNNFIIMKGLYILILIFFPIFGFAQKENETSAKEKAQRETP